MALSELAINQDFVSPQPAKTLGRPPSGRTAGQPMSSRNDIERLLSSKAAFPAQSTPRNSLPNVFATPTGADEAASTASPPDRHGDPLPSDVFSKLTTALTDTVPDNTRFVPETPAAWLGASMAGYDTLAPDSRTPLDGNPFLGLGMAGQPPGANDSGSSLADADVDGVFDPDELAALMQEMESPLGSANNDPTARYSTFLGSMPPLFTFANGIDASSAPNGGLAGPPEESRTHGRPRSQRSWFLRATYTAQPWLIFKPLGITSFTCEVSPAAQSKIIVLRHPESLAVLRKQAHSHANNPPPTVVDRRRPENLKVAREDIQNTGKRLWHEMKLLSNPNAAQPASCPWRTSWLKLAIKHKCTLFNWPDDAPWPHDLRAQLQNSVDQDIVPVWRAFTTHNADQAAHVKLWSKEAIHNPSGQNPPLIWCYRDEEARLQEEVQVPDSDEDDDGQSAGQPARTRSKRRKDTGRTSKPAKGRRQLPPARATMEELNSPPAPHTSHFREPGDESRPTGHPSNAPGRAQLSTRKRKMSDILETADKELPDVETVAYERGSALPASGAHDFRMDPSNVAASRGRPPLIQYEHHAPTSQLASRPVDRGDNQLPSPEIRHTYLMRSGQSAPIRARSTSRDRAHGYGYAPRPDTRANSPMDSRRAHAANYPHLHTGHAPPRGIPYPPLHDAPSGRSEAAGVAPWYPGSRPESPLRPPIPPPTSVGSIPPDAWGAGLSDHGAYAHRAPYLDSRYVLPQPRPMPTADHIGQPAGSYWPRDAGVAMAGSRYSDSSSRDARDNIPRRILSHQ
ncbi:hypothetical protein CALCODRAFT_509449 [Calocera cornea HHB12733]|uniref:Uncharacterized protein n=1 Tax=Calocera cornea HHB12733 TaxID=1353952 RepID=A0A165FAQ1_9BASI|nr:hypothetical protein CALCODRAFT_509449 [Calocera cornea HHB12733]